MVELPVRLADQLVACPTSREAREELRAFHSQHEGNGELLRAIHLVLSQRQQAADTEPMRMWLATLMLVVQGEMHC